MSQQSLTRDKAHGVLGGVCAGLSARYGYDVSLLRVLAVLIAIVTSGLGAMLYLVAWILIPRPETAGRPAVDIARTNADEVAGAARDAVRGVGRAARSAARRNGPSRSQHVGGADDPQATQRPSTAQPANHTATARTAVRRRRGFSPPRAPLPPSGRSGPPSS